MNCVRCGAEVVDIASYKPDRRFKGRDHLRCGLVCVSCGKWAGWEPLPPLAVGDSVLIKRGSEADLPVQGMANSVPET